MFRPQPHRPIRKLELIVLLTLGSLSSAILADEAMSIVPAVANSLEALVPKGWKLESKVEGNLNRDQLPDVAVTITQKAKLPDNPDFEVTRRLLVLALRQKDGKWQRSAVSDRVALNSDEGGVWGDPFQEIRIERGALVIEHFGGSNWRWGITSRYRFQDNQWSLIGRTDASSFTNDPDYRDDADRNFSTGLVVREFKAAQGSDLLTDREKRMSKQPKVIYWQIPAPFSKTAPDLNGDAASGEWPKQALKLNRADHVITPPQTWTGPADSSATLRAVCTSDALFVIAEVSDDHPSPEDRLRLTDLNGVEIKPTNQARVNQPSGYVVELSWSRASLIAALPRSDGVWLDPAPIEETDSTIEAELPLVLELQDVDQGQPRSTLSTRPKDARYSSAILIMDPEELVLRGGTESP